MISPDWVIVKSPFRVNLLFVNLLQRGIIMMPIYAQRIREVRQAAGMTQTEFATAVGTTKNQLSKYELGTQDTPTKIIIAVCSRFGVDANWLLGIEEEKQIIKVEKITIPFKYPEPEKTNFKLAGTVLVKPGANKK